MTLEQIERAKASIAKDITEIIAEAELLCGAAAINWLYAEYQENLEDKA